jgi:hypothetical protein
LCLEAGTYPRVAARQSASHHYNETILRKRERPLRYSIKDPMPTGKPGTIIHKQGAVQSRINRLLNNLFSIRINSMTVELQIMPASGDKN